MLEEFPHSFGIFAGKVHRAEVVAEPFPAIDFLRAERLKQVVVEVIRFFRQLFRYFQAGNLPALGKHHHIAVVLFG